MPDASNREVAGPPPVRKAGGASFLIRDNRPSTVAEDTAAARIIAAPPPAPRTAMPQTIVSAPEAGEIRMDVPVAVPSVVDAPAEVVAPAEAVAPAADEHPIAPEIMPDANETTAATPATASTPYTRRRGAAPAGESPNDIIKVTFEIRRGDRDAFNAAFVMAQLQEGYDSPKELLQSIYNAETRRIEQTYNNGEPFPLRRRQLPRGRPIKADR